MDDDDRSKKERAGRLNRIRLHSSERILLTRGLSTHGVAGRDNRHDFKNQLGVILGFSEILLAEAAAGDPRRGDFEEIHKAATAALDLLERLFPIDAETQQ